jgi:hypothetical protein
MNPTQFISLQQWMQNNHQLLCVKCNSFVRCCTQYPRVEAVWDTSAVALTVAEGNPVSGETLSLGDKNTQTCGTLL